MNILLTGANGFIGKVVADKLKKAGHYVIACARTSSSATLGDFHYIDQIDANTDWKVLLNSIDVVIHCAARVHIMNDDAEDPLGEFRKVNTIGTLNLAYQAQNAGVKRFIFMSSIKVNGEYSEFNRPFTTNVDCPPADPYAQSKYEAEQGLWEIANNGDMEVVVIRPTLVYGVGVKGNFLSLMKSINKGLPLPLAGIRHNKRSLVSVDNLCSLIERCISHPKAANQTFLVSDNHDVSTAELIDMIAKGLGVKNRALSMPPSIITLAAKLIGKPDIAQRLCSSLQVDISHTMNSLDWKPVITMQDAINKTAQDYLANLKSRRN